MPSKQRTLLTLTLVIIAAIVLIVVETTAVASSAAITVEWSTASELNTVGFNLYRGENKDGPFTRINPEVIPASPDPLVGGSYVFTDTGIALGRTYYYQLEEVETGGTTSIIGTTEERAELHPLVIVFGIGAGLAIVGLVAWIVRRR